MHGLAGRGLILFALLCAGFGIASGFWAGRRRSPGGLWWTEAATYLYGAAMIIANIIMVHALWVRDFSVSYVAQVGSHSTPDWVTVVSLWSSLEGSILFWGAILGGYMALFCFRTTGRHRQYMAYALATMLCVGAFFALLLAGPANPFIDIPNPPSDGPGPNPLLQNHILMAVHPPLLYLGYVGFTVPFGIAVAALLRGRMSSSWLKPLRVWTMAPWAFLTFGIVLGGWWAYEVLGWGGYWAWDPVENASFLPWLAATGYLHATVVQERRRMMKLWTLVLVLGAFLLTILGTFMTRSGVFNSVHSFTQSPIGPLFLVFLGIATMVCVLLLASRSHMLVDEGKLESPVCRETAFIFNNLIFVVFTFTVLLGTVFPLINEAINDTKISVGEPYFNKMATPAGILIVFMMGVGPLLPWGRPKGGALLRELWLPAGAGVVVVIAALAAGLSGFLPLLTFGLCGFATVATVSELVRPIAERIKHRGEPLGIAIARTIRGGRRRFGGYLIHLAMIMIIAGVAASQSYKTTLEVALKPGQSFELSGFKVVYDSTYGVRESNRDQIRARFSLFRDSELLAVMEPSLNYYRTQREPLGTPHVETVGNTDVYLSILSIEDEGEQVAVKAFTLPLVAWLWWSLAVIALGSIISLWPQRRRRAVAAPESSRATAGAVIK